MLQLTIESRDPRTRTNLVRGKTRDPKRLVARINGRCDGKKIKNKK